jgi:hypothetical protein
MKHLRRLRLAAPLVAMLAAPAGSASAAGPLAAFFPEGAGACWGRSYDAAHLAKHPRQKVRAIHLADPWDRRPHLEIPDGLDYHDPGGDRLAEGRMTAELVVERVDVPGIWETKIDCSVADGKLRCIRDEDDPRAEKQPLEMVARDGALIATLNPPGLDFVHAPDLARIDRPPSEMRLDPGADDRSFRLERLPPEVCRERHLASGPDYARDGGPALRVAILAALKRAETPDGFRVDAARMCLSGKSADGVDVRVGFNPGLVDSMVGIDAFSMKAARGAGATRRIVGLSCRARPWKWECEGNASPDSSGAFTASLIRRKGGALFLGLRCLQRDCSRDGASESPVPPLALDFADPATCPEDLYRD